MSVSFKTLIKVLGIDELKSLALNAKDIKQLSTKLKLKPMQVRYLYRIIGINLTFTNKNKKEVLDPLSFNKEALLPLVGQPMQLVTRSLNLTPKKVAIAFSHHSLPIPLRANNLILNCPISKEEMEHEYVTLKQSLEEIAAKYKVTKQSISNWMAFHKIPSRPRGLDRNPRGKNYHFIWSWSDDLYHEKTKLYKSIKDFCKGEKISLGLYEKFTTKRNLKSPYTIKKCFLTKEEMIDLYLVKKMTLMEIAEDQNVHYQTICRLLKKYGLVGSKPKSWNLGRKRKKVQ